MFHLKYTSCLTCTTQLLTLMYCVVSVLLFICVFIELIENASSVKIQRPIYAVLFESHKGKVYCQMGPHALLAREKKFIILWGQVLSQNIL